MQKRSPLRESTKRKIGKKATIRLLNLWKDPAYRGRMKIARSGERNPRWAGSKIGYSGLHQWIRRTFGQPPCCGKCEQVGKKTKGRWSIQWANITGVYNRERKQWGPRCRSCHIQDDQKNPKRPSFDPPPKKRVR